MNGQGILERTEAIMTCFSSDRFILTAAEVAKQTDIAISSVHRMIVKLLELGWLVRTGSHHYTIGIRLWQLGELAPALLILREIATPHLTTLYEATRQNVHLAVVAGSDPLHAGALFIARVAGVSSVPTVARVGGTFPLHTTGVGKALLATQPSDWIDIHLSSGLLAETRFSIVEERILRQQLDVVRARNYAVAMEEMSLGTASVAAPVGPIGGFPGAAIGVVTTVADFRETELAAVVRSGARAVSDSLRSYNGSAVAVACD
ncbi:MAG TPA: IclR family transcriptional regulator [Microbacterium sp.]|nr:IclR family transcriptional regulator [Microbacterium sp.]